MISNNRLSLILKCIIIALLTVAILRIPDWKLQYSFFSIAGDFISVMLYVGAPIVLITIVYLLFKGNVIKNWLNSNSIYFTTIAAVSLTGMAVYLSYGANKILEKQTSLTEMNMQPTFAFREIKSEKDFWRDEKISTCDIIKTDGSYESAAIETYREIAFEYKSPNTAWENFKIYTPFYSTTYQEDGAVFKLRGYNNETKMFVDTVKFILKKMLYTDFRPNISDIAKIKYTDKAYVTHQKYYRIYAKTGYILDTVYARQKEAEFFNAYKSGEVFWAYKINEEFFKLVEVISKKTGQTIPLSLTNLSGLNQ